MTDEVEILQTALVGSSEPNSQVIKPRALTFITYQLLRQLARLQESLLQEKDIHNDTQNKLAESLDQIMLLKDKIVLKFFLHHSLLTYFTARFGSQVENRAEFTTHR